jgi:hypothetical protein
MKELYDVNYKGNERDYVYVGKTSTDKELKESYLIRTNSAKQTIKEVWGEEGMFVRKDMLTLAFGYRSLTLGDEMLKSKSEMNLLVKGITGIAEHVYATNNTNEAKYAARVKASILAKQFQRKWEETVSEIKDIIVLRTGFVLAGNEMSNISMLKLNGMSFVDAVQTKGRYLEALNVFREQTEELDRLTWYLRTGYKVSEHPQYLQKVKLLEESINKNPVKKLIDAGFMPTIVEDVETETQDYSYKGKLINKIENFTGKFGKLGNYTQTALNTMYVSESSSIHKFMKYATQVSDFTARGALYEHLSKQNKYTEAQIMSRVSQAFVNYSVPSHRTLELLNRLGLVMFTKFILRIQKPLFETMRENPLATLQLLILNHYFDGLEVITESAFTERMYNPFKWGAGEFPFVTDDIMTVNAVTSSLQGLSTE